MILCNIHCHRYIVAVRQDTKYLTKYLSSTGHRLYTVLIPSFTLQYSDHWVVFYLFHTAWKDRHRMFTKQMNEGTWRRCKCWHITEQGVWIYVFWAWNFTELCNVWHCSLVVSFVHLYQKVPWFDSQVRIRAYLCGLHMSCLVCVRFHFLNFHILKFII